MTKLLGARYWQSVGEVSGHISCGPGVLEIWSPRSLTEAAQGHRVQHIWHKVTTELEGIEDLKPSGWKSAKLLPDPSCWLDTPSSEIMWNQWIPLHIYPHTSIIINQSSINQGFIRGSVSVCSSCQARLEVPSKGPEKLMSVSTVSTNHTTHPNSFRSCTCAWKNNHNMKTTCNLRLTRSFVLQT